MPAGVNTSHRPCAPALRSSRLSRQYSKRKGLNTAVGDEGGFAPNLGSNEEALNYHYAGHYRERLQAREGCAAALDVASSEFFDKGKYQFEGRKLSAAEMVDYYEALLGKYPILSIEDGLAENDWNGWKLLTERLGQ